MFDFSYETQAFFIDAASGWVGFAANWFLQSTILISIGLLVGWMLKAQGSAVQSVVYRTTLLAIFACPLATLALSASGFTGWSIDMPLAWERSEIVETADELEAPPAVAALPAVDSDPMQGNSDLEPFAAEFQPDPLATFESENAGQAQFVDSNTSIPTDPLEPATPIQTPEPSEASTVSENAISIQAFGLVAITASLIWLAVALFFSQRLCSAWHSLRRLIRNSTPVDNQILTECDRLARQVNVATPRLLRSPFLPSPCLAGIRRPTILMPAEDSKLSIQDLLIHELAHLRRRDCHWNLLRQIATAVFFFQPLVWILSRRIEVTAEEVCDDFVVQFGGDRGDYAKRLIDIAELSSAPIAPVGVGVVALRSMLSSRVSRILDTSREISTRASRLLLMSVLGCGILGTAMTGLLGLQSENSTVNPETVAVATSDEETGFRARFEPGESKDLGDVTHISVGSMEKMRTEATSTTIRTTVLLPDGSVAKATHVALLGYSRDLKEYTVFASGTTSKTGECTLTSNVKFGSAESDKFLVARKDGLAIGWKLVTPSNLESADPITVNLHEAGVIKGRLIDIEGQPAVGEKLQVKLVFNPDAERESIGANVSFYSTIEKLKNNTPQAWIQPVITDQEGRFELIGVPKGFGVYATLYDSEKFAPQGISLNTGQPEQRKQSDRTYRSLVKNVKPSEEAVFTLPPAKVITGKITYEDTGEPVPNTKISIWASQEEFGSMSSISGTTDADGKYRMLPKPGIRFGVSAFPPSGTAYMGREAETLVWENADTKRNVDIKLPRVTLVKGRVIEKGTGKPVDDATITFEGSSKNAPKNVITGWQATQKTNAEGKFTFAVPQGHGTLTVRKMNSPYVLQTMDSRKMISDKPGGSRFYANAFHKMKIEKGTDAIEAEIEVLPGKTVRGVVVDQDGNSVEEVNIVTRLKSWDLAGSWRGDERPTIGGKFELKGLAPDETYKVHFLDPRQKLGATVELKATDQDVRVVLQPCGSAKAKFVATDEEDRTRLKRMTPFLYFVLNPGVPKYDFDSQRLGKLAADIDFNANLDRVNYGHDAFEKGAGPKFDDDLRVTYSALIPGATYRMPTTFDQHLSYEEFVAKPGETLDLGEFTPKFGQ